MSTAPGAERPIGVFDSGAGGLTVAKALLQQLPGEQLVYVGDTAHGPYGPLTIADVRRHALSVMDELVSHDVKMLVIACNSASSACLRDARERYEVPVVEVIQPAARRAVLATRNGRVGVLATRVTVDSRAYDDAFAAAPHVAVTSAACPRFVDFVERGITSGPELVELAQQYLAPVLSADVDTLVLGCTHYPLLADVIRSVVGDAVTLVTSGDATAEDVRRVLSAEGLAREADDAVAAPHFFVTGDPSAFAPLVQRFLFAGSEESVHACDEDQDGPTRRCKEAGVHVPRQRLRAAARHSSAETAVAGR